MHLEAWEIPLFSFKKAVNQPLAENVYFLGMLRTDSLAKVNVALRT
jgi:hypothetical protein